MVSLIQLSDAFNEAVMGSKLGRDVFIAAIKARYVLSGFLFELLDTLGKIMIHLFGLVQSSDVFFMGMGMGPEHLLHVDTIVYITF